MSSVYHLCLFTIIAIICHCKEKPAEHAPVQPAPQSHQKPSGSNPFVPPADSSISTDQMKAWSACNQLLDSLTFRYADSFKTENPAILMRYQEDFIAAQNKICIRAGLPGGYQEYRWILQNMGVDKNREVLQSANAQTF